ncbi:MAG: hypothetical protein CMJ18_04825 [Phycisphaeraceae bacterium]|nr:hypothetical protein [Phycisphaeraceae bacterium]
MQQAAELIREAARITVTTHAKPDGDAFGAVVAMATGLRSLGKQVDAWIVPPMPGNLEVLEGAADLLRYEPGVDVPETDLLIILDTGASTQLEPLFPVLASRLDRALIVDHHLSGDVSARWRLIDHEAAACCEQVVQLLGSLGIGLEDEVIRQSLFIGIATDTGWFRFSNTRPFTHEIAAALLHAGVDHADLYGSLYQNDRREKLRLMARALASLKLLAGDTVAVMVLREEDFVASGAGVSDLEQLVDLPQVVGSIRTVVLVSRPPEAGHGPEPVRLSFRSKPGPDALNVADLARRFGGGGHARAAGAKVDGELDDVVSRVISALAG